jgi:hypothetical protein
MVHEQWEERLPALMGLEKIGFAFAVPKEDAVRYELRMRVCILDSDSGLGNMSNKERRKETTELTD